MRVKYGVKLDRFSQKEPIEKPEAEQPPDCDICGREGQEDVFCADCGAGPLCGLCNVRCNKCRQVLCLDCHDNEHRPICPDDKDILMVPDYAKKRRATG